jgi:hypothetical protein
MELPRTKAEVVAKINQGRARLEELIAPLAEDRLAALGPDGWSAKDHLIHLAAWQQGIAALLRQQPRYQAMGLDYETRAANSEDAFNAIIHERSKHLTPAEAVRRFRRSCDDLLAAIGEITDADLRRTYSYYQPDEPGEDSGTPITSWVAGNSYAHYAEHEEWIRRLLAAVDA